MGASRDRIRHGRGADAWNLEGSRRDGEGSRRAFSAWDAHRTVVEEVRPLDDERVLVLGHSSGRGKASGVELDAAQRQVATLYQVRDENVIRHVVFLDRADASADLGLGD